MEYKPTYLFDICGTLYHSNTTYDFLLWFHKKYNFRKYLFIKLALSLPSKALYVLIKKLGRDFKFREKIIFTLKGVDEGLVEKEAKIFVSKILINKKNSVIYQLLNEALKNDAKIILVSASISPVVNAISQSLNVNAYISSELEVNKEKRFTGRISEDIQGRKLEVLKNKEIVLGNVVTIATDNLEDFSLIQFCNHALIVSKQRRVQYWKQKMATHPNWQFIYV